MTYREARPPAPLRELAECVWSSRGSRQVRVLPDGCMDLIDLDGRLVVAGPDTGAHLSRQRSHARGVRFRPGVLPRLLGVSAAELRDLRVPLSEVRPDLAGAELPAVVMELAATQACSSTAPWSLPVLRSITRGLATGAAVSTVAADAGYSARTLQRQCVTVYGYPPAMLRRILRLRRALALIGAGVSLGDAAARAGYADHPHLHRECRALAGVPLRQLGDSA
ncbi:AraC family transcriptional regulator [Mycolicibacterium murale]|uniref:AraC family transcriptional regulator n=1 Tax=Mycolicibacterium murale TaxID=182220 RepID=A0A7I9WWW6_9MYCO|nr:helix-turn-helix domain-containing protein [Mycolicibacterium murale]MCV7184232.1 helix-turn-helix domain-containing protein [Mycolicibacterium murale]GFG62222.1 AraC family transcriptional regulator [Mycolicibacterium murale]